MAKRGFFGSLLSATIVAVVGFFILYFFIPSMSMQFLGISFAYRQGSINAQVMDAVSELQGNPDFSGEAVQQFRNLLNSAEVQQQLRDAAKQGQQVLTTTVKQLMDTVR
jgi:hypothetical protein